MFRELISTVAVLAFVASVGVACSRQGDWIIARLKVERANQSAPIDFENVGADVAYIHGKHCIDGRTF